MDLLLSERQGAPPSVVFSPGIPTSRQLARRSHAEQLGWKYGLGRRDPEFFPDPDKKGPDPDNKGGNKRMMIKSKKNSKMHSKNKRRSKRRSNTRRRHRNSYK